MELSAAMNWQVSYCDRHQIYLDLIPGEAHWKLSVCERSIQAIKHVMASLAAESPALTAEQILAESVRTLNHRENVRGFTPVQYVLGRAPDEHGRFFNPARDLETPGVTDGHRDHGARSTPAIVSRKSFFGLGGNRKDSKGHPLETSKSAGFFSRRPCFHLAQAADR